MKNSKMSFLELQEINFFKNLFPIIFFIKIEKLNYNNGYIYIYIIFFILSMKKNRFSSLKILSNVCCKNTLTNVLVRKKSYRYTNPSKIQQNIILENDQETPELLFQRCIKQLKQFDDTLYQSYLKIKLDYSEKENDIKNKHLEELKNIEKMYFILYNNSQNPQETQTLYLQEIMQLQQKQKQEIINFKNNYGKKYATLQMNNSKKINIFWNINPELHRKYTEFQLSF